MAVYKRDIVDINLETGNIHRSFLKHSIGYMDQKADHFGVRVFRNGEPVNLTGVSVQGVFMPPQGSPIAITTGNIVSDNVAEVVLPQACYNYDGQFTMAIKLVDSTNEVTGTVRIVDGMVDNTHASGTVAPSSAVPTYQEVLSAYEQAIAVIGASVRFDQTQSLTDAQKATARSNIGAPSTAEMDTALALKVNVSDIENDLTGTTAGKVLDARQGKVLDDKVSDLKSALYGITGNNAEPFCVSPATVSVSFSTSDTSVDPSDGNNRGTGCRTTYIRYYNPLIVAFNNDDYLISAWIYTTNGAPGAYKGLTGGVYLSGVDRKIYIPNIPNDTSVYFRLGFVKPDGTAMTSTEKEDIIASLSFYELTDKTLTIADVPADAKVTGDRLNSVETAIEKGKNTYTVIKSYTLATDYTGDDYIVVSDKKPASSGWTDDNTMVTILLPDDGSVQRLTVFRNNSVYSCGSDGLIISTWANESVPNSSVSYGRKPNGTRADYIAFIISKTHIANTNYNTIITNTATFYTPFIEKGETVIFKNGILQADYDLKMPAFSLGNLYANGDIISSTTRSFAPWMNIKKGTVIDTSCTAVDLIICGVSATQKVYVSSTDYVTNGRRYTFAEDTYCVIRFDISSWNIEASAPTLDTPTQGEYFIRYILPEEIAKNPWKGKTWYSYGTSISDIGVGDTSGNNGSIGKWPLCVDALSGMTRTNGAIGSGSIMPSSSSGGNEKAAILQCPFNVDLVTLELGPNDNYWDYLGQVGDTGDDTFLGNLYQIYDYLTKNTRALIVFVGIGARNLTGSTSNIVPANGEFRTRYRTMLDAVKKLSDLFGIPVIDADANACNLNRRIKGVVMRDYIHYTYLGGEIYGRYVWSQLKDMKPYYKFVSGF